VTALLLLLSFVLIVGGAILFTNAVEWAGTRLNLGEGAVGSLLAAVGTALPESLIPIVAVLAGVEGEEVAIGAIIGAPFMLGTVAMMLIAGSAVVFAKRRKKGREVDSDKTAVRRDLGFFLPCFAVAIALGVIDVRVLDFVGMAGLLIAYVVYAYLTVKKGGDSGDEDELGALYFDTSKQDPPNKLQLIGQLVVGLLLIVAGAELFVEEIKKVSESVGLTALALAGLRLVPSRGAVWGTVGASMMWLGAGLYGVGLGGLATAYHYATSPVLDRASGVALVEALGTDFARLYGIVLPGALLVALGTVALSVALWRARTVPRWVPIVAGISILATFVVETSGPAGLLAEGPVALSSVAIGWHAWRTSARA